MEFWEVVRRRRMIRSFTADPIPDEVMRRVLASAQHAPSAGFAQGVELVVLGSPPDLARFWSMTDPEERTWRRDDGAPAAIVLPFADKEAYLRRYSEPDKAGLGMDREAGWPVPYWDLDTAMAAMLIMLAAVDEGLGGWFFGLFYGEEDLIAWLGAPEGCRPIGAIALGYPDLAAKRRGSSLSRHRRPLDEQVHFGGWTGH